MQLKSLKEADVKGKTVLVRVDFNVAVDEHGNITEDQRIRDALPTIKHLLSRQAKVVLMSHFGRPEGKIAEQYRLDRVAERLSELLGRDVTKLNDCINVKDKVKAAKGIVLLENLRFHPEEEANDRNFAAKLAALADVYVNDAFSNSHRAHASMLGITEHLPSYAGLKLEQEVKALSKCSENPEHPLVLVVGGVKLADKLAVLVRFIELADHILIGGAEMFTFYRAKGMETGRSKITEQEIPTARKLLNSPKIMLPVDTVIADDFKEGAHTSVVSVNAMPPDKIGVDIGPESVSRFSQIIALAKTVVWAGPMGAFEIKGFEQGTRKIAEAIVSSKAYTVAGGGDTITAIGMLGLNDRFSYISSAGGAMLKFLAGEELPALVPLRK